MYTHERAPKGLAATAQALFSGTVYGLGAIAGGLGGGYLYDHVGMAALFRLAGVISFLALAAFLAIPAAPARRPANSLGG